MKEENKLIELSGGGIKCDNPNCDYRDESISWDDYESTIKEFLDKPCPKCGSPLLSKEDADSIRNLHRAIDKLNNLTEEERKLVGSLLGIDLNPLDTNDHEDYRIEMNGTGSMNFIKQNENDTKKTS
jgi:ssDNA-binding Zn-finger/Zn-ribbon topoisomerase 1